jgi:hypothetical protein
LVNFLRNMSLNFIDIWFSSDHDRSGGFRPGDIWFDKIREKVQSSSAVATLLTPNSLASQWVFFESGIGAALSDKKLMIVTHNIASMADVPTPLAFWQAHRIDKVDSLREFCEKLFEIYEIKFDEFLFKIHSDIFFTSTKDSRALSVSAEKTSDHVDDATRLIANFDKRFFEITSQLKLRSPYISFTIIVESEFDGYTYEIEITEESTVQDVLNDIYGVVSSFVEAWRYLEQWVLVNVATNRKAVIREISAEISAHALFKPNSRWRAIRLQSPYQPRDSKPELMSPR